LTAVSVEPTPDSSYQAGHPLRNLSPYDIKQSATDNQILGLWRLMNGYRLRYLLATLSLGVAAVSKVMVYVLLAYIVDTVFKLADPMSILPAVALGFLALAFLEGLFTFISGRLAAHTAEGVTLRLRNFLFDHVQRLNFRYHDKTQTGDLIQRSTSDVDAIRRFFADQAIGLGRIVILFVVYFTALMAIDGSLGLASVVAIPVIIIVSLMFFKRLSKVYELYQEQDGVTSTILQENLSGVRVVKAFARQSYESKKYEDASWERYKRGRKLIMYHAYYWPATDVICAVQVAAGFLIGGNMVINGTLSVGAYIAYIGLIWQVINPLRNLGRIIVQISEGGVSYKRLMEMIKQDREPLTDGKVKPTTPLQGKLDFEAMGFEYEAGKPVLHEISFTAEAGQMIALIGSTGSGKTSLVGLLPRFYEYTSGKINLDGVDLKDYDRAYLRDQIGIVEQEPFLFSRSIRENITYGVKRAVSDAEVEAAARAAAVHDVVMSFPDGYKTIVGEKGVTLSGGQKQRVAIARTLLRDPRILILDDATSSVDTETEAAITDALKALMVGRTSFVIAHRINTVMNADLILVFDKGRIVQRGKHDELLAQPGIYRRIYDVQTQIELEIEKEIARV
jgi:ATP-binding cassette, subfamily B, bacterial